MRQDHIIKISEEKRKCENELSKIYDDEAKGYFVRSRAKWIEEGEKSSKYFLGLEKKRQNSNTIRKVKTVRGTFYDDDNILKELESFYQNLYRSQNIDTEDIESYLKSLPFNNAINDIDKNICDEKISRQELRNAVSGLKNNKSALGLMA